MVMEPMWRTKQNKFLCLEIEIYSHVEKKIIVLSSRLAAFPQMYKGSIPWMWTEIKVTETAPGKVEYIHINYIVYC